MPNNNEEQQKLLNTLMNQLNAQDRKKLESVLSDKNAADKILSTPQAQELLKKLMGGK